MEIEASDKNSTPENVTVDYGYDSEDRIVSVTQGDRSVTYEYGEFDDLTGINHNGFSYNYSYDGFGNIQQVSLAGQVLCTYQYNPFNGSLIQSTLADGTTTGTVYDEYGRVTSSSMNDQVINEYVYDNDGQVARKRDVLGDQTTVFDYNDSGLVVRALVYSGDSVSSGDLESRMQYTYTKGGQVGGLSYQEKDGGIKTYTYTYASDTLPSKSEHPDGSTTQWTYDALRRSTQTIFTPKSGVALAKKLYTTYDYQKAGQVIDGTGRVTSTGLVSTYTNKFGSGSTAIQSRFNYTYDTWGNIIGIMDLEGNSRTYQYNDNNEVTRAVETYGNGSTNTYLYSYDAGGNILTETVNGKVNTYSYDSAWKDKLVSYNGKAITYDEAGHPLNYMGSTMTWDASDRLTSIMGKAAHGTASNISYTYLSDGSRRSKTVDGVTTTYHYNNGLLLSQSTGDETLYFYYDSTGKVVSIGYQKGSAAEVGYFFARNAQGDIIAVYRSSDSKLIGTYEYDLWGKLVSTTEASAGVDTNGILSKNPFRYRGYYFDSETGFYYLNARYYNPSVRRFISVDDISYLGADETVTGFNLFVYCGNNPIMGYDPTGHWDWGGVAIGLTLVAAGVITIASCGTGTPIAVAMVGAAVGATGAVTTYAAATDSAMVVDVSGTVAAVTGKKVGASVVIDFKNDNANFYTHTGKVKCNSVGASAAYSVGLVDNYTKPEDYAGAFKDISGGPSFMSLDHCWNPEVEYEKATKATAITFGGGLTALQYPNGVNASYGEDMYSHPMYLFGW